MAKEKFETLIARHEIHRGVKPGKAGDPEKGIKPTKPEIQIIPAGARFVPSSAEQLAQLTKGPNPAARPLRDDEKGSKAAPMTLAGIDGGGADDDDKALSAMTIAEIDSYVATKGYDIDGYADLTKKADKIAAVEEHEAAGLV